MSDTVGQQHGGPPASDIAVVDRTTEEGGLDPWRQGEPQSGGQHWRRRVQRWFGQGLQEGGGTYIKQDNVESAEDFWHK